MTGEGQAGAVSAASRDLWSRPYQSAVVVDLGLRAAYRQAQEAPVLVSPFDAQSDGLALATRLQALHGPARRTWRVLLNRCGIAALPGQAVSLTWPRHGLAGGRTLIIRGVSVRGDRTNLLLWG